MKFKKKLWISLILFILFGTVFSGWIFHQNTTREHLVFDNTTQLVTTERSEDNIRIEDVILPDSFHKFFHAGSALHPRRQDKMILRPFVRR